MLTNKALAGQCPAWLKSRKILRRTIIVYYVFDQKVEAMKLFM